MSFVLAGSASAYELEEEYGYTHSLKPQIRTQLERIDLTSDRLRKFNLVLKGLNIPEEPLPDLSGLPLSQEVTFSDFNLNLPILDPDTGLRRYLSIDEQGVSLFREFFSHLLPAQLLEYATDFSKTSSSNSQALLDRLAVISKQVKDPKETQPLSGLKILIDPGHMGTPEWDVQTGKFVQVQSEKVSEGQLTLWTALLSAKEFESLGATVYLTRTEDGPVSPQDPLTFDLSPYLNQYFYNSLDAWMAPYLQQPDSEVLNSVKNAPETQKAFSSKQRTQFFISGVDLEARSQLIDQIKPDIVIDIHYDANQIDQLQSSDNSVEAFVPGGFRGSETGSRSVRAMMFDHLLETRRWSASVDLAGEMVQGMAESLDLKLQTIPEFLTSIRVKDGVYARNLYITRRNLSSLMVYLECLHYDHTSEFPQLAHPDQTGSYHGKTFLYPARLRSVVRGIRTGLLRYFQK